MREYNNSTETLIVCYKPTTFVRVDVLLVKHLRNLRAIINSMNRYPRNSSKQIHCIQI